MRGDILWYYIDITQTEADITAKSDNAAGWCVYMLRCADGTLYTGCTNNIVRRLAAHNAGSGAKYVRSRLPASLAYTEGCDGRSDALRREREIKNLTRSDKLALISARAPVTDADGAVRTEASAVAEKEHA